MNLNELNELPTKLKNGEISKEQLSAAVWSYIYKFPHYFELGNFDEDSRSEFLITFQNKIPDIVEKFNPETAEFYTFLRSWIRVDKGSWIQKEFRKESEYYCITQIDDINKIHETEEPYEIIEEPDISFLKEKISRLSSKKREIIKNFIHILACRACNDLTDDHITKIADFLGIRKDDFAIEISNLKNITSSKLSTRQNIIHRRNQAYFYKKRLFYQLSRLNPESINYEKLLGKLNFHTDKWNKRNRLLTTRYSVSPSARTISESTGIKKRKVWYYIHHAKKTREIIPFINQPVEEEKK